MAALGVGEEVDVAGDVVVDDEREIRLGGGELFACLGDEVGIDFKGDVVCDVGGSGFDGGCEAVALLEGFHLEGVDGVEDSIELVVEDGVALEVEAAGEHHVNG